MEITVLNEAIIKHEQSFPQQYVVTDFGNPRDLTYQITQNYGIVMSRYFVKINKRCPTFRMG